MRLWPRRNPAPDPAPEPAVEPELVEPELIEEPPAPPSGEYVGRLACDGAGNLLADQSTLIGYRTVYLHDEHGEPVIGPDGAPMETSVPVWDYGPLHGLPVFHNLETGLYEFVEEGGRSHNQLHHRRVVAIQQTKHEDRPGELHHLRPNPADPHFVDDPDRNFTAWVADPDEIAAEITGHTAPYVAAHAAENRL